MDTTPPETHLAELAYDLEQARLRTELTETSHGPVLKVRNPNAGSLSEQIHVRDGEFMWSWNQPVAPLADKALAVQRITRVLATIEG
ncbi:hypothetical protein [Actinomadura kijaniata]|uniref:hypothetical protein n=1 Tax=Actinomadura kijaniata TaxID=46161 RepID=UPI00082A2090|nr:hypothetical protein [Actinomadura kijaniata]